MRIDLGPCVDNDPTCFGPRVPMPPSQRRCAECECALLDNEDRVATERSIR